MRKLNWKSLLLFCGAVLFLLLYLPVLFRDQSSSQVVALPDPNEVDVLQEPEEALAWQNLSEIDASGSEDTAALQGTPEPLVLTFYLTPPPPTPTPTRIPDYNPPETAFIPDGGGSGQGWYRSAVTGTFQAVDDWSGLGRVEYRLDEVGDFTKVPEYEGHPGEILPVVISGEGQHLLEYYAIDSLGNTEPVHDTTINIDLTPPTVTHTIEGDLLPGGSYVPPITVTFNGQDNLSGIDYYEVDLNRSGWQVVTSFLVIDDTGYHQLIYRAVDRAGNLSAEEVASFVVDTAIELVISNISRSGYVDALLGPGDEYYIDRSYTITSLPSELEGLTWIKTANNDKYNNEVNFLSFDVNQNVVVYIGYDNRTASLPGWMNTYQSTTFEIAVSDSPASPLQVWRKSYVQGTITLGGNHQGGDTGARSNYVILVEGQ